MDVHFSSKTTEWETPRDFFNEICADFKIVFDVDVCATKENTKADMYWTKEDDGLSQDWSDLKCWMNPPYGREIGKWVKKAYESAQGGALVVCLLPARTDTKWWHEYCMKGEVLFIRGRLKFGESKNSVPFPSAVVIFRPK